MNINAKRPIKKRTFVVTYEGVESCECDCGNIHDIIVEREKRFKYQLIAKKFADKRKGKIKQAVVYAPLKDDELEYLSSKGLNVKRIEYPYLTSDELDIDQRVIDNMRTLGQAIRLFGDAKRVQEERRAFNRAYAMATRGFQIVIGSFEWLETNT